MGVFIGWVILVAVFLGILVTLARTIGVKETLLGLGFSVGVTTLLFLGVSLVTGGLPL